MTKIVFTSPNIKISAAGLAEAKNLRKLGSQIELLAGDDVRNPDWAALLVAILLTTPHPGVNSFSFAETPKFAEANKELFSTLACDALRAYRSPSVFERSLALR
jgi:hypothetical protein